MTIDNLPTLVNPSGDMYVPLSKDAVDYKLLFATESLGLGRLRCETFLVANGNSTDINIANAQRGVILTCCYADGGNDAIFYGANSSGVVRAFKTRNAAGITPTTDTNKITIANSATATVTVIHIWRAL